MHYLICGNAQIIVYAVGIGLRDKVRLAADERKQGFMYGTFWRIEMKDLRIKTEEFFSILVRYKRKAVVDIREQIFIGKIAELIVQ